jgi:hypothetical protein
MEAVIKISVLEFDEKFFAKIRSLLQNTDATEITISIATSGGKNILEEPETAYWNKVDRSVKEIEAGKGIVFTMKEFEEYVNKNFPG